jgi:anti-sigma factor RsiW
VEHRFAVEGQFIERYLLDELSPEDAADFEAHFFECALCAADVRRGAEIRAIVRTATPPDDD